MKNINRFLFRHDATIKSVVLLTIIAGLIVLAANSPDDGRAHRCRGICVRF